KSLPGATRWMPSVAPAQDSQAGTATAKLGGSPTPAQRPGRLAAESLLSLDPPSDVGSEELPLPQAVRAQPYVATDAAEASPVPEAPTISEDQPTASGTGPLALGTSPSAGSSPAADRSRELASESEPRPSGESSTIGRAFHCKSRAFSLDYAVEALGGSALADVELWGTEDGGRSWEQWGSDPDRQSPFDVQVGNDGLFGFRMVIVGANGLVSNRPREGDSADVWINVDTSVPTAHITRAVYGEGPEDGLLVIDYQCADGHLVERPITLSFSERADGPWELIATGLANTGMYLWKADPSLPAKIYLKLEVVDKAGNIGAHRLDLPIDTKGLAPRGVIQGFRPISLPAK
ncbi:MAG: hypothetical protein KDA45_16010, partial [Planctomycetales bacterium]|nr:hypothetical protein [Planctomycetales bacterium]